MGSSERTSKLAASPDLFENGFLNFFSRVHPSVPALIFIPVIAVMFWLAADRGASALAMVGLTVAGMAIWTFSEYWLHRLLFHWQPKFKGGDKINFIIHGVHHDHPNDPMRLVMPPAASLPLAVIFFGAFMLVFGSPAGYPAFAGFLVGYLIYDYTHYYVHHFAPKSSMGKKVREHHMRHHFQDHHYGYGVSSPVWDYVFRTVPRSKKSDRD
ncbi:MAG: sterol desaturase family protein [Solirubrobacterales bacterium]|nr:sterol desaturase family protein [Solirubrobacterales bacterium]